MKKTAKIIYSALFFGICCTPLIAMPFAQNNEEIEKKALAQKPQFVEDGKLNQDFSSQFDGWLNDRLPFRPYLLEGANFIKSELLSSPAANVISGKDGWLFYEDTADSYMSTYPMTEHELQSIVVTMSLLQENVEAKGGNFLFVPIPNKNSVYGEYMPSCYIKAESTDLERLYEKLENSGVNYVDMLKVLTENKQSGLYHKRDTHWNNLGAFYGYNAIMEGLGREHKTYGDVSYTVRKDWRGDLDKLLYPENGFYDEQYYFDIDFDEFRFTIPVGVADTQAQLENFMSDKEENDNRFRTAKLIPSTGRNLYMVRDSFGRALLPFMIDNYDTAMFVRTNCPEMSMVAPGGDMVYEIVERNLRNLIGTAPFMTAPQREITASGEFSSDKNAAFISDEAYGMRIYGVIDEKFAAKDGRIYVKLENNSTSYVFEAFPIYEKELLKDKTTASGCGFSLILDTSVIEGGEYSVSVISNGLDSGSLTTINL